MCGHDAVYVSVAFVLHRNLHVGIILSSVCVCVLGIGAHTELCAAVVCVVVGSVSKLHGVLVCGIKCSHKYFYMKYNYVQGVCMHMNALVGMILSI